MKFCRDCDNYRAPNTCTRLQLTTLSLVTGSKSFSGKTLDCENERHSNKTTACGANARCFTPKITPAPPSGGGAPRKTPPGII